MTRASDEPLEELFTHTCGHAVTIVFNRHERVAGERVHGHGDFSRSRRPRNRIGHQIGYCAPHLAFIAEHRDFRRGDVGVHGDLLGFEQWRQFRKYRRTNRR